MPIAKMLRTTTGRVSTAQNAILGRPFFKDTLVYPTSYWTMSYGCASDSAAETCSSRGSSPALSDVEDEDSVVLETADPVGILVEKLREMRLTTSEAAAAEEMDPVSVLVRFLTELRIADGPATSTDVIAFRAAVDAVSPAVAAAAILSTGALSDERLTALFLHLGLTNDDETATAPIHHTMGLTAVAHVETRCSPVNFTDPGPSPVTKVVFARGSCRSYDVLTSPFSLQGQVRKEDEAIGTRRPAEVNDQTCPCRPAPVLAHYPLPTPISLPAAPIAPLDLEVKELDLASEALVSYTPVRPFSPFSDGAGLPPRPPPGPEKALASAYPLRRSMTPVPSRPTSPGPIAGWESDPADTPPVGPYTWRPPPPFRLIDEEDVAMDGHGSLMSRSSLPSFDYSYRDTTPQLSGSRHTTPLYSRNGTSEEPDLVLVEDYVLPPPKLVVPGEETWRKRRREDDDDEVDMEELAREGCEAARPKKKLKSSYVRPPLPAGRRRTANGFLIW